MMIGLVRRFERGRRFWRHVRVGDREDCWLWEGEVGPDGHGRFAGDRAELRAYELAAGPVPPAAMVEQRCGERRCVNPEHLRLRAKP
jgi:hypothetical protein